MNKPRVLFIILTAAFLITILTGCESAEETRHRRAVELESSRVQAANEERLAAQAEADRLRAQAEHDATVAAAQTEAQAAADVARTRASTEQAERLSIIRQSERDAALQRFYQLLPVLTITVTAAALVATIAALLILRRPRTTNPHTQLYQLHAHLHHAHTLYDNVAAENRRLCAQLNTHHQLPEANDRHTVIIYDDKDLGR